MRDQRDEARAQVEGGDRMRWEQEPGCWVLLRDDIMLGWIVPSDGEGGWIIYRATRGSTQSQYGHVTGSLDQAKDMLISLVP